MHTGRARLGRWWETFFDAVAVATVIGILLVMRTGGAADASALWLTVSLLAAGAVLLVIRRRMPIVAAVGSIGTSALALLVPDAAVAVWVLAEICLFSLSLRRRRGIVIVIAITVALVLYGGAIAAFIVPPADPVALIMPVWTGAVVAFGIALRTQQEYVEALEEQAHSAAAVRESEVLRRVGTERLRIARDLHDAVANSIAVINLESSNAGRHVEDDPPRARRALDVIRAVSRSTLTELSDILAILRDDQDDPDRTVATTANIPHLVELLRASGLPVRADLDPLAGVRLEPSADAALYRVAQESLTNAHRHGVGPVTMSATVSNGAASLRIENAVGPARAPSSGFGLIGMRERVELAGGTLEAGANGSSFVVHARVPLAALLVAGSAADPVAEESGP